MNKSRLERNQLRNTSIFSAFTSLSRFFGIIRDVIKAYALGTGPMAVAFDTAFRIPNMFRNLIAEGAFTFAFLPIYQEFHSKSKKSGARAAGALLIFLTPLLLLLNLTMVLIIPTLIPAILGDDYQLIGITVDLSQFLFSYIVFISLSSAFMAIQYAHKIFWAASFGPALLNVVTITIFGAWLLLYSSNPQKGVWWFASANIIASSFQLLFQIWITKKYGLLPHFYFKKVWQHPVLPRFFKMMLPATLGAAAQQLSQLLDIILASRLQDSVPGAISALTYSHRLIHLPIGILGVAVATASLPNLSQAFSLGNLKDYSHSLSHGMRLNFALLVPSAIGLIFVGESLIQLFFERGEFNAHSTLITLRALQFYAIGIPAYSLQKLFANALYAQKNSTFPARVTIIVLIINIIASILLMPLLDHGGLALGSVIAAFSGSLIYGIRLQKELFQQKNFIKYLLKVFLISFTMAFFLWLTNELKTDLSIWLNFNTSKSTDFFSNTISIILRVLGSLTIFVGMSFALKLSEVSIFFIFIKNKFQQIIINLFNK